MSCTSFVFSSSPVLCRDQKFSETREERLERLAQDKRNKYKEWEQERLRKVRVGAEFHRVLLVHSIRSNGQEMEEEEKFKFQPHVATGDAGSEDKAQRMRAAASSRRGRVPVEERLYAEAAGRAKALEKQREEVCVD